MSNLTIMDIAREAGVSKATVSRVINNSGAVSPRTKERVLEIIKENKFSPSATARNLSKGTSSAIGFVVPEIDNPFFGEILRGVTEITDKNNLTLICCNTDDEREKDRRALDLFKENRVRGILYTPAVDYTDKKDRKNLIRTFDEINVPVVIMDRNINLPNVDGVYFNDYQGIYEATKALIGAGHTRIGIINADLEKPLARKASQMQWSRPAFRSEKIIFWQVISMQQKHITYPESFWLWETDRRQCLHVITARR